MVAQDDQRVAVVERVAALMFHFVASPLVEPGTAEAARVGMDLTFLHWGLHPWAIYSIVGLSLAVQGLGRQAHSRQYC